VVISLASLYFLRFLCPAIVAPAQYQILDGMCQQSYSTCQFLCALLMSARAKRYCELSLTRAVLCLWYLPAPPKTRSTRFLLLIAKTLQSLANR